jgi:hypothetical protein
MRAYLYLTVLAMLLFIEASAQPTITTMSPLRESSTPLPLEDVPKLSRISINEFWQLNNEALNKYLVLNEQLVNILLYGQGPRSQPQ